MNANKIANNEILPSRKAVSRIFGYDLARTAALIGMVIISFSELAGEDNDSPEWLDTLVHIIMGRAAVAFVILAGVGLYLLTKDAYLSNDPKMLAESRKNLMKRAGFLFIVGILNSLIWSADILHFYAVYFLLGSFLLTASNRLIWILIYLAILTFAVSMALVHFERDADWSWIGPMDLWHLSGVFYHLLFGGLYPVFPWIGFMFLGIWLGRRDLTNPSFRKKILLASIVIVVVSEAASQIYFQMYTSEWSLLRLERLEKLGRLEPWFIIDPWEPMPLFFFSGAGSAGIMISLCIILTEKFGAAKWLPPLVAVGQSTLTLYVAHTLIGTVVISVMDQFEMDYPLFPVWGTVLYFMAATLFCYRWNKRFNRGPLELLMRRFLARSIKLTLSGVYPIDFNKNK